MNLSLLIASRGRPTELLRTVSEIDRRVADPERTTISVALDADDESVPTPPLNLRSCIIWDRNAREDSLGEKYNRCARNAPSDCYVLGADDNIFLADGWDELIRERMETFSDGFGFVYFGRLDGTLPTNMAISHSLVRQQGFLFPNYWPVWFHDTWIDEIAHMTGRILWANIPTEEIGGRGKSRGVRDIAFWAALFDALRAERAALSSALSEAYNPRWLQAQLLQRRDILLLFFADRMSRLRDPAKASEFEKRVSFDAPTDERYMRIKARGEELLARLMQKAA